MLTFSITTPKRFLFETTVKRVSLPTSSGQIEILAGHISLLSELSFGIVSYEPESGGLISLMVEEGFVKIDNDVVSVICESATLKEELDVALEEKNKTSLLDQLKEFENKESDQFKKLQADLEKSIVKLSLQ